MESREISVIDQARSQQIFEIPPGDASQKVRNNGGDESVSEGLTAMKRAVIYLRVSTKEQAETDYGTEGFSIPAQREACQRKAEALGAAVVGEFVDRGESAKTADRPELQRMLNSLAAEAVDLVIVHKLDRLARSRADDVAIALAMQQAGTRLVSVSENVDETPSGKLLHGIMATIAEFYSSNLATEARKGMRQKAKTGGTTSKAPTGYLNVREVIDGREVRTVAIDPERAPQIRWAFEAFAGGEYTCRTLAEELDRRGLRTKGGPKTTPRALTLASVHEMLRNPYYIGIVTFDGVQYKGRHDALIDLATWQTVQKVLTDRRASQERPTRRTHWLKGLLRCGLCGGGIGLSNSRGSRGQVYPYFYCLTRQRHHSCELPWLPVSAVEEWVQEFWNDLPVEATSINEVRSAVVEHIALTRELHHEEVGRQQTRLSELDQRADKLVEMAFADAIPLKQLKEQQDRIARERARAEEILAACTIRFDQLSASLDDALARLDDPVETYDRASNTARRDLLGAVFTGLYLTPEGIGGVNLNEVYEVLLADDLEQRLQAEREALAEGRLADLLQPIQTHPGIQQQTDAAFESLMASAFKVPTWQRPIGPLPWEQKNPDALRRGSNVTVLVGVTGLEPVASAV